MYNMELKERFIAEAYGESISKRNACISFFNQFEKYEYQWSADLCTRSAEEIKPIINSIVGVRTASTATRVGILNRYRKWCVDNGVQGAIIDADKIAASQDERMRERSVTSPQHLQKYLDIICAPTSMQTADDIVRCFLWLGFGGATIEQAVSMQTNQINFDQMAAIHRYSDGEEKIIPIYREAVPAFKNCVNQGFFLVYGRYGNRVETIDRADCGALLRGMRSPPTNLMLMTKLGKMTREGFESGKTKIRMSFRNAWSSGTCYRMRMDELSNGFVDFRQYACQLVRDSKAWDGKPGYENHKHYIAKASYDLEQDYKRWKRIFVE